MAGGVPAPTRSGMLGRGCSSYVGPSMRTVLPGACACRPGRGLQGRLPFLGVPPGWSRLAPISAQPEIVDADQVDVLDVGSVPESAFAEVDEAMALLRDLESFNEELAGVVDTNTKALQGDQWNVTPEGAFALSVSRGRRHNKLGFSMAPAAGGVAS